jgi:uncharacterized protein (DUF924 family)
MTATADDILAFWFKELTSEDWFRGGKELDEKIRARFLPSCLSLRATRPEDHLENPRSALAAILVLDQFTRNVFRGTPEAFSGDPVALGITHGGMARGFDSGLSNDEGVFFHMPLMHSEVLADQELSVKVFGDLAGGDNLKYAVEHRDIVAKFGRFPHRNAALGRPSTPAELEWLASGGERFGQ